MNEVLDLFTFFHFIRPGWLLPVPVTFLLWWHVRARAAGRPAPLSGLAPHLAAALRVGLESRFRILAIDGVALTIILASLATAGPTWSRVPSPFVTQTAPLAVALATSESMLTTDVAPNRLERAKQKLLDLLDARIGARTALVAYAGSAHRVVPLSDDPEVLKPFIEGLSPKVMPSDGRNATAALDLAASALQGESVPGAILFILDELDSADMPAFTRHAETGGVGVVFLAIGSSDETLRLLGRVPGSSVVVVTPDSSDLRTVERRVASAYRNALAKDNRQEWEDRGWLLAWPAALLTLVYFRRGWTMILVSFFALGILAGFPDPAQAAGFSETIERVLLTPDQRGRLAFEDGRFESAAELFEDPMWKGYALYFVGRYEEAAETFTRFAGAEAGFARGMALLKGRAYWPAIEAFEAVVDRHPEHRAAAHNAEVARAVLDYLEQTREKSDTGSGSEGADEVVFDAEEESGTAQMMDETDRIKIESANQWMRTVETSTADFLTLRFALESIRDGQ